MHTTSTKTTILLFLCCWLSFLGHAQNWQALETGMSPQASAGATYYAGITLAAASTPMAAYSGVIEAANADKARGGTLAAQLLAITTQPEAVTILGGETASFRVVAAGQGTLTYQWQLSQDGGVSFSNIHNGLVYTGATTPTLTLIKAPVSMNGYQYRVQVSNGTVLTSYAVPLTVQVPPFDNSRVWQVAGTPGFSAGQAAFTNLTLDKSGNPYVAYSDLANAEKATVMKQVGWNWETVGPAAFSAGRAWETSVALDADNTPFVAYKDLENGNKATVKKFDGSAWVGVGPAGFSASWADFISLALDAAGTPYVAFKDAANGGKATVMQYTGSSWVTVGAPGFSAGLAQYVSLAIDAQGTPFVAYMDYGNSYKVTVMKYTGTSWVAVGTAGFSAGEANYIDLALDANDTPFVVFLDRANGFKATVMQYRGSSWVAVGGAGFSAGPAHVTSLALDAAGVPYVAYRDEVNGFKATVMRYTGTGWVAVGSAGFSAGQAASPRLALDAAGTPFVVLGDMENQNKATVMKFATPPPSLSTQPAAVTITGGESASFTVSAAGPGTLSYQWQVSRDGGASFSNISNGGVYSGAATATLTLTKAPISMNGYRYRVQVGNGGVTTSNAADLMVNVPAFDHSRVWQAVGTGGFSAAGTSHISLALDAADIPFIAYKDNGNGNKATVMEFTGSGWEPVGAAGFSAGVVAYTSLVLDASGTPYVAYQDESKGGKATVMKFTGSNWVTVGAAGFSAGSIAYTSLALDASGTPYVAYKDGGNGDKVTVMKFTGGSWVAVGTAGFSSGGVLYPSLALDARGMPHVAYRDLANSGKATVMKFNGSSWETIGAAGFSAGGAESTSLALDASGTPYVAYHDSGNGGSATVMKFNGTHWVTVGAAGFSGTGYPAGAAYYTSLVLDASGTPYVAYLDSGYGSKAMLMKFNGSGWEHVAGPDFSAPLGFSTGVVAYTSLALGSNGTPYVAYKDEANGSKATVMKFAAPSLAITTQPLAVAITGGESASFTVSAAGTGTLSYQWQVSQDGGASFSNISNGGVYSGAATATLTLTKAPISMNGYQYRVQVSSGIVATSDAVALTVQVPAFDNSRVWQLTGAGGFSAGRAAYNNLALEATGIPFVAYADFAHGGKVTVSKYTGGSWVEVGSAGFSAGQAYSPKLAFDVSGAPFVAYIDNANGNKVSVKKYTGSSWADVGPAGFSAGSASTPKLALDAEGTPFVAYNDGANGNKVTVKKYTGSSWADVGPAGFSAGPAYFTSIALDADGTPFVAYYDEANSGKATVKKYTGSSWADVGSAGFSAGQASDISIVLDANGTPFVAYNDGANGGKTTVKKYAGNSWEAVGPAGFSTGKSYFTSFVLDASGTPFVAYQDEANGNKVTVKKYTGSSWVEVGGAGFSAGGAAYISLAIGADGTPFVTYSDDTNGNKATVMTFTAPPVTVPAATVTTGTLTAAAYCAGAALPVPFSTTGTFGAQNTFTAQLSDATGSFAQPTALGSGTTSPLAAIIPAHVVPGTGYRIRVVAAAPLVVAADNGSNITINSLPGQPGTITGAITVCPGQTGISYSISPVSGATAYSWSVPDGWQITAGQGTTAITLTAGSAGGQIAVRADNACGQSAASTLAVSFLPVVANNVIAADQVICLGTAAGLLAGSTPGGGNAALAYLWESSTASATEGFAPAPGVNTGQDYMAGDGIDATTWFRRRVLAAGCPATATYSNAIKITVLAPPAMPAAAPVSQCGPGPVTLTATGAESSTSYRWYTTAAGGTAIAGETGAVFTSPELAATTTYYVAAVNAAGCESDRRAVTVTIHPLPQVVAGADSSVCADAAAFLLTGFSPAGGSWLGPGLTPAGVFSAAAAGPGTHTLIYSATENGCTVSAIRAITVKQAPTVSITPFTDICSSKTSLALTGGEPAGGTWSGPGVSEGIFNPSQAGAGTHALTYSYTDASGCGASASQNITVTACTGIADEAQEADWSLYPNPTSGKIKVALSVQGSTDLVFRILRADGSLVMEKAFPRVSGAFTQVFDMGGAAKGLYLLQQLSDQGILTKQFVLQ